MAVPRPTEASAVRRQIQRRRRAALAIGAVWLCAHVAAYGVRQDLQRLSAQYVALQLVLPALLAAGSLLLAVAPGKLGMGLGVSLLALLAVLGPLAFWLFAAGLPLPYAADSGGASWLGAAVCLDLTLLWESAPLLLAGIALQRAFPASTRWRSALVGGAIGLACGSAINLHCSNPDPAHLVGGHGIPIVVAALVGGFVLSRWIRA
jgi:phosphotransferase system  glucose/maltose/N-acetylglucosamine-specific IIC component